MNEQTSSVRKNSLSSSSATTIVAEALAGRTSTRLSDGALDSPEARSPKSQRALRPWQAKRVEDFIEKNVSERITVVDLSALTGLSCNYFSRAFKLSFGQPPHAYLIARRVHFARHLLSNSDERLSAIALAAGFSDQAHLCRIFRRYVGPSPSAWRQMSMAVAPARTRTLSELEWCARATSLASAEKPASRRGTIRRFLGT